MSHSCDAALQHNRYASYGPSSGSGSGSGSERSTAMAYNTNTSWDYYEAYSLTPDDEAEMTLCEVDCGNSTVLKFCELFTYNNDPTVMVEQEKNDNVLANFIAYGVLLNLIGIFGIFGNIISLIILSRPQMKSSINYLLIGLARCDTGLIITSILLFGLPSIYTATGYMDTYYHRVQPIIAPYLYPIGMILQTISVYLTLMVALERYVAVCHPLRARYLCTCGRARFYTIVVSFFSILYNFSRFWEVSLCKCMHNDFKMTVYKVYPSPLRKEELYIKVYIHWMYLMFMYFIPFGCLSVLNTLIYRQVRRANQERQRLSRLQKKEIGLATMLLAVVVVFLICNMLALVTNVLEAFWGQTNDYLVEISNLMITLNSSVNFVIYVIFGEKFKRLFFKLFFPHGLRLCGNAYGGRESPDQLHEDSFVSCMGNEERVMAIRRDIHRLNTLSCKASSAKSTNGRGHRSSSTRNSSGVPAHHRASSPGPCVYYPSRESRASWEHTSTTNF